jgi:hypothetical protein
VERESSTQSWRGESFELTDHMDRRTVASGKEIGTHHVGTCLIACIRTNCRHDRWVAEIGLVGLQRECIIRAFTEIVYIEVRGTDDRTGDIVVADTLGVHADDVGASLGALFKSGLASRVIDPGEDVSRCLVDERTIWIRLRIVDHRFILRDRFKLPCQGRQPCQRGEKSGAENGTHPTVVNSESNHADFQPTDSASLYSRVLLLADNRSIAVNDDDDGSSLTSTPQKRVHSAHRRIR